MSSVLRIVALRRKEIAEFIRNVVEKWETDTRLRISRQFQDSFRVR
jgi:hypothetical protein